MGHRRRGECAMRCEPKWMATVMLHSSKHLMAWLPAQTWCTWSSLRKLPTAGHGNWGEGGGWGKVRKLGYIYQNLVDGSICCKLMAESVEMWWAYVIHCSDNMYSGGSEIERPRGFWMHMIIHRNNILDINNFCMHFCIQLWSIQWLLVCL